MKKYKVILFQKYLRSHILNFGKYLNNGKFILKQPEASAKSLYARLPDFHQEINRKKTGVMRWIRKALGIINIRIKIIKKNQGDIIFTYGCALITNKPYCIYLENGLALYNYDLKIAKNPIAKILFWFIIRDPRLKKLIFMSEAAQASFLSTIKYSQKTQKIIHQKSIQCYPVIKNKVSTIKKYNGKIKLLFLGMFYMKGGLELIKSFNKLNKKYNNIELTIITPIHTIKESDKQFVKESPNIILLNAEFNEKEMYEIYKNHDIFILPTFRDSFGLVLIEALSYNMPIICTSQFATNEMIINDYNGFIFENHPLKDYNQRTLALKGKYHNPKDFYLDLFKLQSEGKMKPIEQFIYQSIEKFILNPELIEKFSKNSLELYNKKFHYQLLSDKIESAFLEAIKK